MRKYLALLMALVMIFTMTMPSFSVFAEEQSETYQLIAEDTMWDAAYGVAGDTALNTNANTTHGTGWTDAWISTGSGAKFDGYGVFTGRPGATANVRMTRTLANEIDFSKERTYTFTAEVRDGSSQQQSFVFEIGDTGIAFGANVAEADGHWLPQLQLPGKTMTVYSGSTSDDMKRASGKSMFVVLEITTSNSGDDIFRVKTYGEGKTETSWLLTQTAEISNLKASAIKVGYDYCADYATKSGVSRVRAVKIESDAAAEQVPETGYYLFAEDNLRNIDYGYATNTEVTHGTYGPFTKGTGWADAWATPAKLDNTGMFITRPTATANSRVKRTLKNSVDFSKDAIYTFTATLDDGTVQTQNFVFELGNTGIAFGALLPDATGGFCPQIQLPGAEMTPFAGEIDNNMKGYPMNVVLEVTTNSDGDDILKVGLKKYAGTDSVKWYMTKKAEISNLKVDYVNIGYNFCADYANTSGVSRIRSVKIERDDKPVIEPVKSYAVLKAYDDFESYADASDTSFSSATTPVAKLADIDPINGGNGWGGAWRDGTTDQIAGTHSFNLYYDNGGGGMKRELDLYSANLGSKPLSRPFESDIDFSKAGEYYINVLAQPSIGKTSGAFEKHNLTFHIGDKLSFGTKYVEGKSIKGTAPDYYAHVTAGDNTVVGEEPYVTATYHNYFAKIVADGKGNATISLTIDGKGTISASASGLTAADKIKITDTDGATSRICYIDVEGYTKEQLDPVRKAIALYSEGKAVKGNILKAISVFDTLGKKVLSEELNNADGFSFVNAYDDFEGYADADDAAVFKNGDTTIALKSLAPVNGGTGWGSAWKDNEDGTITGSHVLRLASHNFIGTKESYKYYREISFASQALGSYPVKREFYDKIDFTEAGEYYIKVSAEAQLYPTSANIPNHNLTFSIGNDISFGTKYVEGKTVAGFVSNGGHPYFYPHLTVNGVTLVGDEGVHTGQYYDYVLKIVADGNGNADVTFTLDSDKVLTAKATNLTKAEYFGISDRGTSGSQIAYVQVEGYPKTMFDATREAINAYMNGTESRDTVLELINGFEGNIKNVLMDELSYSEGKKYVYEDFESYEDPTDKTKFPSVTSGVFMKNLDMNGGIGWNGPWYDSNGKTISANHQLCVALDSTALDLYSMALETTPLKRDFAAPIDFSRKGEYYLKINGAASIANTSVNFHRHNLTFSLGDKISFGTKYVEGKSDSTTASKHYFPHFTAGDVSYVSETGYPTATYHSYVLHIVSNGDGSGIAEFKMYQKGTDPVPSYMASAELKDVTTLDYLKVSDSTSATARVSDISMEFYDYDVINPANDAIEKLSKGEIEYKNALSIVNNVTGLAKEQLLAELDYNCGYIRVDNSGFKSASGVPVLDSSKITDSIIYNFELYNNYKVEKTVNAFLAVYYDDYLAGVKTTNVPIPAKTSTELLTLGFEKLPEGEREKVTVKAFVFENANTEPMTDVVEMYSADDRAVEPEMFGKDTDDKVVVAFMGDSITHLNPSYHKWIEYYYRIKYPNKDIKFASKGISGDSAAGNEARFYWDILNDPNTGKPTEACIMIGMNDVNRRLYPNNGSEEQKQTAIDNCLKNIADIADLCEKEGVKLTLITPTLYDESTYTTSESNTGVNEALGKIAAGVIKLANERNLPYIDFYGYINEYNSKLRATDEFKNAILFNVTDRIHATAQGTFAAGFFFLTQQLGNSVIASTEIDASSLSAITESAEVSNVAFNEGTLSYTYAPKSLPMYKTTEYQTVEDSYGIPVTDFINREIIKVSGLEEGTYKIMMGDAEIGTYSSADLAKGVNIATAPTNPGYIQSKTVYDAVCNKLAKDNLLRNIAYVERAVVGKADLTDVDACINYIKTNYATSTDGRYISYEADKKAQADAVKAIAQYEKEAMEKAIPKTYEVKIIKQ